MQDALKAEIININANNIEVPERTIESSSDVVNPNAQLVSGGSPLTLSKQADSLTLPRQLIAKMVLLEGTQIPNPGNDVEIHSPVGTSSAEFDYKHQKLINQFIRGKLKKIVKRLANG